MSEKNGVNPEDYEDVSDTDVDEDLSDSDTETVEEEVQESDGGQEPEVAEEPKEPWKHVRSDLYRRQSRMEQELSRIAGMVEGISRTREVKPATPRNPMEERLRFQQDPSTYLDHKLEEKISESEERIAERVASRVQQKELSKQVYTQFQELKDEGHPFTEAVNKEYYQLLDSGHPQSAHTVLLAARLVEAEKPNLREKKMQERRRDVGQRAVREATVNRSRVDTGAPRPRPKTPQGKLNDLDDQISQEWKVNLKDKATADWIRAEKSRLNSLRVVPKRDDEE